EPLAQGRAGDALHHDAGLLREVAAGDELRYMRTAERRQDHLLDLEADDGRRVVAAAQARHLHDERQRIVAGDRAHAPQARHAALVGALFETKALDDLADAQWPDGRRVTRHRPAAQRGSAATR